MTTLAVLEFNSADGADQALRILQRLQQQQLVKLVDAAVVTWPQGSKGPKTRQVFSMARAGALGGAFWGFLFGLIFFVPLLGFAIGAAAGAIIGALTDFGIDDNFIKQISLYPARTRSAVIGAAIIMRPLNTPFYALQIFLA